MNWLLAIDPGEEHCGIATFRKKEEWTCVSVAEVKPPKLYSDYLMRVDWDVVVVEEFRLYPWVMQNLAMTPLATCEVIGVIKYLCEQKGFKLAMQPAAAKTPTEGQLRARKISLFPSGGHARDAQLHGWYHILRSQAWVKS